MPRRTKGWFLDSREDGVLYINNLLSRVKGVGKKAMELLKRNGIKTVANLCPLTVETMHNISETRQWLDSKSIKVIPCKLSRHFTLKCTISHLLERNQ
jgi:hypothetical protein